MQANALRTSMAKPDVSTATSSPPPSGARLATPHAPAPQTQMLELRRAMHRHAGRSIRFLVGGAWQSKAFADVWQDVDRAVARLRGWGIQAGDRVGVFAKNCYEWVICDLALIELRAVSVALPETLPDRVDELVERLHVRLVLGGEKDIASLPASAVRPWVADWSDGKAAQVSLRPIETAPEVLPELREPTIVFSSGTSGRLKTLRMLRTGLEHAVDCLIRMYPPREGDRLLLFLPFSNVQQRMMMYGAFYHGIDLIIASPEVVIRAMRDEKPTILLAPPLFFEQVHGLFLDAPWAKRCVATLLGKLTRVLPVGLRRRALARLFRPVHRAFGGSPRLMITGMAAIRRSTLDFFHLVGLPVFEAYGVTECGLVAGNSEGAERRGSVGRLFDPGSVTIAADGEVIVHRVHTMAAGYIDEPDEAEVYRAPHVVHTGDIGHFDRDGFLYLDGRKKEIIVTASGHKVHPESLESVLNNHPAIERAAVVLSEDRESLTAVVSLRASARENPGPLLAEALARANAAAPPGVRIADHHALPGPFTVDEGLLTRNLKVDRRAVRRKVFGDRAEPVA